jgi:uncharacterized protein (TIGR03118 family)
MRGFFLSAAMALAASVVAGATAAHAGSSAANAYVVTPLVSDQAGGAPVTDPNLKNPWGVAFTPAGSPFWIADNNAGVSTLYDGNGTIVSLVVTIPCPPKAGQGSSCPQFSSPTGLVWNPTTNAKTAFLVPGTTSPAEFIWSSEDGTISAWAGGLANPDEAVLAVDNSVTPDAKSGAVYKGLAFGINENLGPLLFATNFRAGTIDVFAPNQDSSGNGLAYKPATTDGGFSDPGIPAGYAPFGIASIDGNLIVTYALQDAVKHDDRAGEGHGFVDAFDTDGHLLQRLASQGMLNSPWGIARASFAFGPFGGDLLIGNFGNSRVHALTRAGLVSLNGTDGNPLTVVSGPGLWTLMLGGGAQSSPATLYFTAGPNKETDGLFGTITPASSP